MAARFFFGYGSLVDSRTHVHAPTARVAGWRRAWCRIEGRPLAILTAVRAPGAEIDGLIAPVVDGDWAALDAREFCYLRRDATADVTHDTEAREIAIYEVPQVDRLTTDADCPILLSYLDVVVHGYLTEFGPEGVARFIETTDGWHTPVLDDRAAPRYPRAQSLSAECRALVDDLLAKAGSRILTP